MSDWPWDPVFEVAFDVDPLTDPGAGDWTDLSDRIAERFTTARGMGRSGNTSGEAQVQLNNRDRALDPTNSSATYNLVPVRHARLRVVYDSTTYDLFRGWVDAWSPSWPSWGQGLVDVRLFDAMALLATIDTDVDLPRQTTGARIGALLDLASWPESLRDVDDGRVYLDPLEQAEVNVRRAVEDCADAEDGHLWVSGDGKITFRDRHSRLNATSQATFGVGGMKVSRVRPAFDTQLLTNVATVERENGDVHVSEDSTSVTDYGERDLQVRDLDMPGYQAEALANWIVYRFAEPSLWLDGVTVEARNGGAAMFGLSIGDLTTFAHSPPGSGDVDVDVHVERIRHEASRDGSWRAMFDCSPYFGEGPWLTLDDATLGQIETTNMIGP